MLSKRHYLSCVLDAGPGGAACVVNAPSRDGITRAHVLGYYGASVRELEGSEVSAPWDCRALSLGASKLIHISVSQADDAVDTESHLYSRYDLFTACWDAFSGCLYATAGHGMPTRVVRVTEGGSAAVAAGQDSGASADGESDMWNLHRRNRRSVPFTNCSSIASDGEGCLYCVDNGTLCMLQLPATWQTPLPTAVGAAGCSETTPIMSCSCQEALQRGTLQKKEQEQAEGELGEGSTASSFPAGAVEVTTIRCGNRDGEIVRTAYDAVSRSLVFCTDTAVYSLPIAGLGEAAAVHEPVLLAGREEGREGHRDGMGADARFNDIYGIAVDGTGAVWVVDRGNVREDSDSVRWATGLARVDPNGGVHTVWSGYSPSEAYRSLTVLPNGCLAMVSRCGTSIMLLQLGLTPPCIGSSPSPKDPSGTLAADLAALLGRQPDGSADVDVDVEVGGGQVFAAHRSVLAARSHYFRRRLDPGAGFADGSALRLSLPAADPAAFGVALRFMYTDSTGPVPPELLQPVGALADRLLLPGLCTLMGSQLLGRVCLENVVGLLLWAQQRSGSLGALLRGLKAWVLQHHGPERGRALPDEDVVRLMRESPALGLQLLYHRRADED